MLLIPVVGWPALLGFAVASRGCVPDAGAIWLCACFVAWPIFCTLSFPIACIALARSPGAWLTSFEMLEAISAFAFWRTIPFVARNLSTYLEAWWLSGLMSLAGHSPLPLSPWGVVRCYLGNVLLFNELLLSTGIAPRTCWLARAIADPRFFSVPLPGAFD